MPTAPTVVETEYVTPTVAAALANRCEDTIRQWLAAGKLTPFKLLGRTVVKRSELDAMLAGTAGTKPAPPAAV